MMKIPAKRGAVAAGHQETANAAITILDAGGNAFDAALAGFLAACVAEPVLASLGGGGFLTARTSSGSVRSIDFFTQTPSRKLNEKDLDFAPILADFGTATQEFHIGLGSVATPGAVAGVFRINDEFGRMPISEIAQPAIQLAREGVRINGFQAYLLDVIGPIYRATSESRSLFCTSEDDAASLKQEGDTYTVPAFADFMNALCADGPRLFYEGEIASAISSLDGCSINRSDLLNYKVVERAPLETSIHSHKVHLTPPPAIGGALVGLALGILETCDLAPSDFTDVAHVDAVLKTMQRCNAARIESNINVDPVAGAQALQAALKHPQSYKGTTHISVADVEGNLAAVTVSNGEGCGHIVPGTGVMLNNMLGEEDLNAAGFFEWTPDVRLSSMMTPGMMVAPDGTWTAFGSGGSNRIRSALTQVIFNIAVMGRDVEDAVAAPRLHLEGDKLSIEPGFEDDVVAKLEKKMPNTETWPEPNMFFGGAHLVSERDGRIVGGAGDRRRDGVFLTL